MNTIDSLIEPNESILITGSSGFIGQRVVRALLSLGYHNLRCLVRTSIRKQVLAETLADFPQAKLELFEGNLLYAEDCRDAVRGVSVIVHLAAGSDTSFSGSVLNCAVTTKNLLEAVVSQSTGLKRFVNVSSFSVYSNYELKRGDILDETCPLEKRPFERNESYCYGKLRQDRIMLEYAERYALPYVILRPGYVYGPGRIDLSGRIGIDTFGFFMHLGGRNILPLTYVDNCADAIALAAVKRGVDGQVFNIVDDDLPTSRQFLRRYRACFPKFTSVYVPYSMFYAFSFLWEKYSAWTNQQLPPVLNRRRCVTYWRGNRYSNAKLKGMLGWQPRITFQEGAQEFLNYIKGGMQRHD